MFLFGYLPAPLSLAILAVAGALDYSRPALLAGAVGVVMAASLLGQACYRLPRGVGYDPGAARALQVLQAAADIDDASGALQHPRGTPATHRALVACLLQAEREASNDGLAVISLDIDLALVTGERNEEGLTLIDPSEISRLQRLGYIVGTCSDREPSDQLRLMETLGQNPDFAIPKELLAWARRLLPGSRHLHMGDDPQRDRDIALEGGWTYQTPGEYTRAARAAQEP